MTKYIIFYFKKRVLNISRSELFYPKTQRCCTNDNARAFFVSPSLIYTTIPLLPRLRRGWGGGGEVSHVGGGRGGENSYKLVSRSRKVILIICKSYS